MAAVDLGLVQSHHLQNIVGQAEKRSYHAIARRGQHLRGNMRDHAANWNSNCWRWNSIARRPHGQIQLYTQSHRRHHNPSKYC